MSITGYYDLILLLASSPPSWAILIACVFVILALCLSTFLVFEHLSAYKNPEEQKFLIGVILMVPCYAVESLVSLVDPSISVYFGILRDCYESFAMYCFGRYLVACLGMSFLNAFYFLWNVCVVSFALQQSYSLFSNIFFALA
ncbi:hypothetical protein HS088_TW02G00019 [Tripterygium wilfordii]|uniref:Uncharacterized protein n=1 Tax=Tripterygium wilfordii TaxID=458696 RepID=A0A7J7DXL2_TRIWF|nr:hypothetical protein HS088_TW02G00019 [Tripterygium wilfordii]